MSILRFSSLVCFCLLVSALAAEPLGFYQDAALNFSSRIRAAGANAAAARSAYFKESVFKENPELMVGYMNVPLKTFPALNRDSMSSFAVGISQKIALPWEAHYRKAQGERRAEAGERNRDMVRALVLYEVAEKYNALLFNYHRAETLKESRALMRNNLAILARSVKLQKNIVPQILEAKANLALLDNDILELESDTERQWLEMEVLCGRSFTHAFSVAENQAWNSDFLKFDIPKGFVLENNLQYKQMRAEADAEIAMLSLSKSSLFPEVTLGATYMARQNVASLGSGAMSGDDMVTITASTPLPVFYPLKNKHEIDAQKQKVKYAEAVLAETALALESSWKAEKLRAETLRRSVENYTRSILPAHSSAHKAHLASSAAQGMGVSEALAAYQMLVKSTEERLRLIRDFYSAYNRLQYLANKATSAAPTQAPREGVAESESAKAGKE